MRERDLNRNFADQRELQRIATILFPKKQHPSHHSTAHSRTITHPPPPSVVPAHKQQESDEGGQQVRSEIDKLRKEINCMLARGGGEQQSRVTEHAYLDGINRMAKGLAISAVQVREAFEEFLEYLPTRLTTEPRSYALHYHYSLLLQHVAWHRLENALRTPLAVGFQAIRQQAQEISELQERVAQVERQREERWQRRRQLELGRAMLAWRMNGHCIAAKQQSDEYLREHGLEGEQRLAQSLLNLPLLVLMLEELGREAADISELLLLDSTAERATKFMEDGLSGISSSLETVTQRSLLQTDRSGVKFSRFQVTLGPSLTALCVRRGEILFVSSLAKSADYGHADNLCYWQSLGRSSPPSLRGGAIFYPIFDANARCIAILRQYFYEGGLTALDSAKLERICTFLELGVNLDQRMRNISREREYLREDYYMKMIGTVRKVEEAEGEGDAMKLLEEELKSKLGVEKLAIYRIQSGPGECRQLLLRRVWGEGEDLNAIMTLAHQLLKQQRNYIYLEDRLLVYANQALFDLRLPHDRYSPTASVENVPKQTLPIELIVNVLSKVQSLLTVKEREGRREVARTEEMRINQAKEQYQKLSNAVEELSLQFISKSNQENYVQQINSYISKLHVLLGSQQDPSQTPSLYLQYQLGKAKREKYCIRLGEHHGSVDKIPDGMLKVHISQVAALYCSVQLQKQARSFEALIIKTIELFMAAYTSLQRQKSIKNTTNSNISTDIQAVRPIPAMPTKQDKKTWQKSKLQSTYQTFRLRVQDFAERALQCPGEVVWAKQKPSSSNLEDWKHSIYRLLQNKEGATIELTGKYPLISYAEYKTLRVLTSYQLSGISEECSLVITGSKGYRSKNSIYENSFALTLPVFYYQGDGTTNAEKLIAEGLQQLKEAFLHQCQYFVDGVNLFNQRLASSAVKSVVFRLEDQQLAVKKEAFRAVRAKSDHQEQIRKCLCHFQKKIRIFQRKLVCRSFCRVYALSQDKLQRKRKMIYQLQPIQKLCSAASKIIFGRAFVQLETNCGRKSQTQKGLLKFEQCLGNIQLERIKWSFTRMHLITSQRSNANQLILSLSSLFQQYSAAAFFKIKRVEGPKAVADPTFSQFQQCQSFSEIRQKLAMVAPQFLLLLQATPDQQILLHSPKTTAQPVDPFALGLTSTYQAGPDGNFLWYYSPKEGATAFQIKDRLNTLSKCLQISLKNCKKAMGSAMLHCSSFKGNWVRRTKAKALRVWALESSRLEMAERNKLNDSLYQMGIESKTIKEKLKAQEKILRNHSIQNQELLQKQAEYRRAITANSHQISAIEQGQIKLQNSRSVYHSLHRRGVLKGIFLLWRVNSSEIGFNNTRKQLESNPHVIRVAVKSIARVFDGKRKEYLSELVWKMSQVKRVSNCPRVEKIEVMFQDRAARLVTFQSELEEQENSQEYSNRSESSQMQHTKRHFDLNRSPLQRVELSADQYLKHANGAYRLNPKTLKFLKRMGKLEG